MKNIVFALLLFLTGATVQAGPPQTVLPPFALPYNEGAAKSKQSGAYLVTFVGCKPLDVASSRMVRLSFRSGTKRLAIMNGSRLAKWQMRRSSWIGC